MIVQRNSLIVAIFLIGCSAHADGVPSTSKIGEQFETVLYAAPDGFAKVILINTEQCACSSAYLSGKGYQVALSHAMDWGEVLWGVFGSNESSVEFAQLRIDPDSVQEVLAVWGTVDNRWGEIIRVKPVGLDSAVIQVVQLPTITIEDLMWDESVYDYSNGVLRWIDPFDSTRSWQVRYDAAADSLVLDRK